MNQLREKIGWWLIQLGCRVAMSRKQRKRVQDGREQWYRDNNIDLDKLEREAREEVEEWESRLE